MYFVKKCILTNILYYIFYDIYDKITFILTSNNSIFNLWMYQWSPLSFDRLLNVVDSNKRSIIHVMNKFNDIYIYICGLDLHSLPSHHGLLIKSEQDEALFLHSRTYHVYIISIYRLNHGIRTVINCTSCALINRVVCVYNSRIFHFHDKK